MIPELAPTLGWDAYLTAAVLAVMVVLFVTERLRVDLVALLGLSVLLACGVASPTLLLSGFANPAVVTVASMFVLSAGLLRSGAGEQAGLLLARLVRRRPRLGILALMLGIGVVSAFINNTAAVAIMLPIILDVSRRIGMPASKLLMPLSFASMFGGVCTLIGTSTNLLASDAAQQSGAEPFGMFEMAPLGLVFFAVGIVYMMTIGARLLPDRGVPDDLAESFGLGDYLTDVALTEGSEAVDRTLLEVPALRDLDLDVVEIRRGGDHVVLPLPDAKIRRGDVLRIRAGLDAIGKLRATDDFRLVHSGEGRREVLHDEDLDAPDMRLLEVVIPPFSRLVGTTLEESRFRNTYGATVLAIRQRGKLRQERLKDTRLMAGDTLLLEVRPDRLTQLRHSTDLIVVSEVQTGQLREKRLLLSVGILAAVVSLATTGLVPIVTAALLGCVAMVLTRCLTLDEAYAAVDWKIVFLLAGVIGVGKSLEFTGLAGFVAAGLVEHFAVFGPLLVLSGFYLLTSLLTEAMSNNATVVLLAPIAVSTAAALGVDARPFLMAVTFAASASFMTPVGYQTNTLIYGPGRYRFSDFLRVGLPLNVAFWLLATLLIPVIWPF